MNHTSKHGSEIIKHKAYKTEIKIVLQNDNKTKQKKKTNKKNCYLATAFAFLSLVFYWTLLLYFIISDIYRCVNYSIHCVG